LIPITDKSASYRPIIGAPVNTTMLVAQLPHSLRCTVATVVL